jgi:hypothetical protein
LRDFASIVAYLSDPEIDELQAVINERRKARARLLGDAEAPVPGSAEPPASEAGYFAEDLEQVPTTRESERDPG